MEEEVLQDLAQFDDMTRKTINSGALKGDGDIHTRDFCIDTKKKSQKNFNVTRDELEKNRKQGINSLRTPLLVIENEFDEKAVVMSYSAFLAIMDLVMDNRY